MGQIGQWALPSGGCLRRKAQPGNHGQPAVLDFSDLRRSVAGRQTLNAGWGST